MSFIHRSTDDEDADEDTGIDLAPMLDFVMNLLVFFIITAAFVKELGLPLSRPKPQEQQQPQQDDNKTLFIAVHENGDVSIRRRPIDWRSVRPNVERFLAENADGPVVVVANIKAPTGALVQVMDQARLAGARNVTYAPSASQ